MVLCNTDLYKNIIENELEKASELHVISGYASANFLSNIVDEFPHVNITLFIGMYREGISKKDHEIYKNLTLKFESINVYYQIEGPPTHMKLLEFISTTERTTYIGSANFTDNGFKNNRELMVKGSEYTGSLFRDQRNKSMICTSHEINNYINFYDEKENINLEVDTEIESYDSMNVVNENIEKEYVIRKRNIRNIPNIRTNINERYYDKFSIEIVLNKESNPRWDTTGINRLFDDKIPSLCDTPRLPFYKLFPEDTIFDIHADDGNHYKAKLTGITNRDLILVNGNFYEYVKNKAGIEEYKPISRPDLESVNMTKINFERIDKNVYFMYTNKE